MGKPSKLWKSLSTILRRDKNENGPSAPSKHSAEDCLNFFQEKVANVWASTSGNARPEETDRANSSLTRFQHVSDNDVRRIIMASPTKSCSLDPVPTFSLKEVLDVLLPYLTQKPRFCHITPVLSDLHWLPACHRISFEIATVTFSVLQFQQPSYLASLIPQYVPTRALRSSSSLSICVAPT